MTGANSMHEADLSKPVLWDNPEGSGGEGGGRGFQDVGAHVRLWLIHVDVWQGHHSVVKRLTSKKKK